MPATTDKPRRTRDGGYIVPVDSLEIGDRIGFSGMKMRVWWPIVEIREMPKTRDITVQRGQFDRHPFRLRRTTLIARAPREGES